MMTARLVLRDGPLTQTVEIPAAATTIGESVVGLRVGQTFTRRELLEGLVVWSGNDAAEALALAVGGSDEGFARLANREAARLGMKDSRYITAYGLDRAGQYSTALDQARLARVLMRDPRLRKAVRLRSVTVNGQTFAARNKLLGAYPGLDGVKISHTDQAGWSLAASAVRGAGGSSSSVSAGRTRRRATRRSRASSTGASTATAASCSCARGRRSHGCPPSGRTRTSLSSRRTASSRSSATARRCAGG